MTLIGAACATTSDECCCTATKPDDGVAREEKAREQAAEDRIAVVHWQMQYMLLRCEDGDVASCAELAEGGCDDACRRHSAMERALKQLTNTFPHPLHRTKLSKDAWLIRVTLVPHDLDASPIASWRQVEVQHLAEQTLVVDSCSGAMCGADAAERRASSDLVSPECSQAVEAALAKASFWTVDSAVPLAEGRRRVDAGEALVGVVIHGVRGAAQAKTTFPRNENGRTQPDDELLTSLLSLIDGGICSARVATFAE